MVVRWQNVSDKNQWIVTRSRQAHLEALWSEGGREIVPRHRLVLGGEAWRWKWVKEIQRLQPGCQVWNLLWAD